MSTPESSNTPANPPASIPPSTAPAESAPLIAVNAVARPVGARRSTTTRSFAIALATIAALVVVAVIGLPRRPSPSETPVAAVQRTEALDPPADRDSTAVEATAASAASPGLWVASPVVSSKKNPKVAKIPTAAPSVPAASAELAAETPDTNDTAPKRGDAEPAVTGPAPAPSATETAAFPPVTITGCLEVRANDDRFRLVDTEGESAPKGRSWRTGFLKKRSSAVDLVDPPDGVALESQVGKKVAATGVLTNRALKVSSLRVVAPDCN